MEIDSLPDQTETKKNGDQDHEIRITPDPALFSLIQEAALYMQISHEDLVIQILKGWARKSFLPLMGKDRLCTLNPDDFS